ncbi:hypothetical protein [Amycolatopsis jejuensis]|uniref:hypothetical protein n=1 Tax=Amycolatopsis jejuensis TaxID=330084 RepID=UPI000526CCA4|nr:hypothetical protein [Amycolatopsis jejuensis]
MSDFEDRLLDDLLTRYGAGLEEVRRKRVRRGPHWIAGAAGVVLAVLCGAVPQAYAVTRNTDGSVTVSVREVEALGPANAKLRQFGVRAKAVPMTPDCASLDRAETYRGSNLGLRVDRAGTVTIGKVPDGYTILLGVRPHAEGSGLGYTAPIRDPAPSCLLDPRFDPDR